ncbi:unnamed protein product [Meganyctiphanes norvegica]|uniref:Uncharacterized protein n=1 Tax=Meganyctiphanes norvegica TaxID=48144 RepID=A0AAV2QY42_MEGNR
MASRSRSKKNKKFALLLDERPLPSSGRHFYTWKPRKTKYIYKLTSSSMDNYEVFEFLSHVEHFQHFEISQEHRKFFPNQISYWNNSRFYDRYKSRNQTQLKFVWFGPKKNPYEHNWYGNISYTVPMKTFMDCMKFISTNLYFVEIVDFKTTSATRFLFSHRQYIHLQHYDPTTIGGPWYEDENGEHFFAKCLNRRYLPDADEVPHEFEIMIELQDGDYSEVFKICDTEAVDHSDANEVDYNGKPCRKRCKQYQTSDGGDKKEICPTDWSISRTEEELERFKQNQHLVEMVTI